MNITLVDVSKSHIEDFYSWELDLELQDKTGVDIPRTYTELISSYDRYFNGEKPQLYLKTILVNNIVKGRIELFKTGDKGYIGIVIGNNDYRNIGVGSEAINIFLKDIKETQSVNKVISEVYEDNLESIKFFIKNGFMKTENIQIESFRGINRNLLSFEKFI